MESGENVKKTWSTLKSECINLGFDKTTSYQKNPSLFIEAANRAINHVATTVRPIIGKHIITQYPIPNLLNNPLYMLDVYKYDGTPASYQAENVKAYYFECDGNGTATLTNGTDTITVDMESTGGFKAYRGFISGSVTLTFSGDYFYSYRNVAMYGITRSANVDDIPAYSQYIPYDMDELTKVDGVSVFFDFADDKPIQQGCFTSGNAYRIVGDYKKQERKILLLNQFDIGQFEVWYKKYPMPITAATPDDYELEIDYDVANIVPYLMAHDVWMDDDIQKATMYYNKADSMKNEILGTQNSDSSVATFKNTTGWWDDGTTEST